jgi:hypothetical protein
MKPRPSVHLSYLTVGPLLICCMIQLGNFSGCRSSSPPANAAKENALRDRVNALQNEPLGPIDLGNAIASPTENTEYIIAHKDEAVPLLVEALHQEAKPVLIGYAAYCLRRIGSNKGKEAATTLYQKLAEKGDRVSLRERFARNELKEYLDQVH